MEAAVGQDQNPGLHPQLVARPLVGHLRAEGAPVVAASTGSVGAWQGTVPIFVSFRDCTLPAGLFLPAEGTELSGRPVFDKPDKTGNNDCWPTHNHISTYHQVEAFEILQHGRTSDILYPSYRFYTHDTAKTAQDFLELCCRGVTATVLPLP